MMGVSRKTLERRIHEWGWTLRSAPRHATDRALVAMAPAGAVVNVEPKAAVVAPFSPVARTALAARIQGIVAQGLDAVERVLTKVGPADESGAERSARTLAAVARTLHEMAAFTKPNEMTPPDDADDNPIPRDIGITIRSQALIDDLLRKYLSEEFRFLKIPGSRPGTGYD